MDKTVCSLKYNSARVIGQDATTMVTIGENGAHSTLKRRAYRMKVILFVEHSMLPKLVALPAHDKLQIKARLSHTIPAPLRLM